MGVMHDESVEGMYGVGLACRRLYAFPRKCRKTFMGDTICMFLVFLGRYKRPWRMYIWCQNGIVFHKKGIIGWHFLEFDTGTHALGALLHTTGAYLLALQS
jgi:hypothetical protein